MEEKNSWKNLLKDLPADEPEPVLIDPTPAPETDHLPDPDGVQNWIEEDHPPLIRDR